jgi:hypothetical protein
LERLVESMQAIKNNASLLLFFLVVWFALGAATFAKEKPLSWKPIDEALLRVNDAPPKDWEVYRTGKKNDPLLLELGNRFLLIDSHDQQIFELEPLKLEHKKDEILWNPADRPAKPLTTSEWVVNDVGAAFGITVKLDAENATLDLQLPHPPNVGSLPARTPAPETRRHY